MSASVNNQSLIFELVEAEKAITCGEESKRNYAALHEARFKSILQLCRKWVPDGSARVLDIGRSELTFYLSKFYSNIHTLGLDLTQDDGGHREQSKMESVPHFTFDLLKSHEVSQWPQCGRFDLIVFSEVIEHLYEAPEFVFNALGSLLSEKGVLICTTPNAAEISKRGKLLLGQNPYDLIRLYQNNPGHVREYTREELCCVVERVGLKCVEHAYFNWLPYQGRNPVKAALRYLVRLYPRFRSFQACVIARA